MAGTTLDIFQYSQPDSIAQEISSSYRTWNNLRSTKMAEWEEIRRYIFATDTSETSNSALPWKNKTTIPKLCQIRDNLAANYIKGLFPKRKWLHWIAYDKESAEAEKRQNIENMMYWIIERSDFTETAIKLVLDYIDYGNSFSTVEWVDERKTNENGTITQGYVGPRLVRISPLSIVFNPTAANFSSTPKIIRSLITMGELKRELESMSTDENRQSYEDLFNYLTKMRGDVASKSSGSNDMSDSGIQQLNSMYQVDGFSNFTDYLNSGYAEVLTFYGDLYDKTNNKLYSNYIFKVVDCHKLISSMPNPSFLGSDNIFHTGWRVRQDNLWAMGPLDNLVGMQYRLDHLENLKADIMDLVTYPVLKIKGQVDDFEWGPLERIYVQDDGSDVELLQPEVQALNMNLELTALQDKMEEMAGAPKEALGFRTPGEKTKYEVQRLENASNRIFISKIEQLEAGQIEKSLNGMLEMARRLMPATWIRVFDDQLKIENFNKLTPEDITANGRIRPMAARYFAEQAEKVQNINAFLSSQSGMDPAINVHLSGEKLAEMMVELLDLQGYDLFMPFIRLTEQAQGQQLANAHSENTMMAAGTPSGLTPDDHSLPPQ
jgi:hypothetical protein